MKTTWNLILSNLFFALLISNSLLAQDIPESTGLPGDNFSLEGALELFKKAESPEAFEKALNSEDNYVNNLDLNEDGKTDYIRVIDNMDGDVHALVLQVPVNKEESQDIAVIEIEKEGAQSAVLQIIGDETIYGSTKIVEPFEVKGESGGKGGPSVNLGYRTVIVNVWAWPSVRFLYRPAYRVWVSPFRWGYYPRWWAPWRPRPWNVFGPRVVVYRPRYRVVTTHRVVRAHRVYTPVRRTSRVVSTRTTVVKGKNTTVVSRKSTAVKAKPASPARKSTKTTVVKGKNGNTAVKRSTTTSRKNPRTNTTTRKRTSTTAVKKSNGGGAVKRSKTTTKRKRKG